ncbi:RNA methyltransferase [Glycomyces buryatensis]|uniref:RNA methyltransferase n=1 Tax=Glycomyces buryatensis TaxID=2570927 RepID=A0A4S8QF83_9ACTN|nr:RNA methyltransferase [Glycomyces buryatensis]THV43030.1 RNA methyltransferase [Glycomyces buryatensis]
MGKVLRVSARNARFQQWEALLTNRKKRNQAGGFLVQGVRPIDLALEHGWTFQDVLFDADRRLSDWARGVLDASGGQHYAVARELMAELGEKESDAPELLAVVSMPDVSLRRIKAGPGFLGIAFDRPGSPGNLGSLLRSADAFSADVVITTGHGADPFDPRSVRASTGSLFSTRVAHADRPQDVAAWITGQAGAPVRMVGTDEHGENELAATDLTGPTLLVLGRETDGMSRAWHDTVDVTARIPIGGAASSLNAAAAGSIALYEAARQRSGRA